MSGKITVQSGSGVGRTALLVLLSAGASLALCLLAGPVLLDALGLEGGLRGAALAVAAYVIFRTLYGALGKAAPGGGIRTAAWSIDGGVLTLDGGAVPLGDIRAVYCWPNRDALGHVLAGWTVNIETVGKNRVLRSVTEGPAAELSVRQLRALVDALGYGDRWQEER